MNSLPLAALAALYAAGAAAQTAPLPKTGAVKHAAYAVCRSLAAVDLGEIGSNTSAECTGIVRTTDGSKTLDNLAIRCLEESVARKSGYKFTGTCVETDAGGDKLYLAYEGPESGPIDVLGGTGKFKGVTGHGQWRVADAPGNTASLFAFTLDYDFSWTSE
ncbi:MAG: hypothetical protein KGM15_06030 [Pseudomonadota bacterium]|nr:hypothetical protein [Pseudomonadota bacterium]